MSVTSTVTNVVLVGSEGGGGEGGREGGRERRGEEGGRGEGGIDTEKAGERWQMPFPHHISQKSLTLLSGAPLCLWQ